MRETLSEFFVASDEEWVGDVVGLLSELVDDFGANSNGSIALTVDGTASPSYGISCTLRDYGLIHQWIAQSKALKSFYASASNLDKDLYRSSEAGKGAAALLGTTVAYESQGWIMPEYKIIYTLGSYGQVGITTFGPGSRWSSCTTGRTTALRRNTRRL